MRTSTIRWTPRGSRHDQKHRRRRARVTPPPSLKSWCWRRRRDSNPRYAFGAYNGLANRRLQPLGHVSASENIYISAGWRSNRWRANSGENGERIAILVARWAAASPGRSRACSSGRASGHGPAASRHLQEVFRTKTIRRMNQFASGKRFGFPQRHEFAAHAFRVHLARQRCTGLMEMYLAYGQLRPVRIGDAARKLRFDGGPHAVARSRKSEQACVECRTGRQLIHAQRLAQVQKSTTEFVAFGAKAAGDVLDSLARVPATSSASSPGRRDSL